MNDSTAAPATDDTRLAVDAAAPVARPGVLHRGDARLLLRPRGGSRRARPPRPAQAADDPVRPIGPGQDVDPARRHRPAAAAGWLLPGLRTHRLFARIAGPDRADQAGDLPRNAVRWRVVATGYRRVGRVAVGIPAPPRRRAARRVREDADPAADLRPVRGIVHARAKRRIRAPARRAIHRGPGRPGRESRAQGARGEDGRGRVRRRALRLHAQRLPHPDRAARGLPGAPRGPQGQDALDLAEPDAAGPHDRRAGAERGVEARRQARVRGGGRFHRALRRRRRGTRQRRSRARAAVAHLPRTQQRAHRARSPRDFGGPAGRLARHHPVRILRARAGRPARRRPPVHRGQPAHRIRPSRKPGRGARAEGPGGRRRAGRCAGHTRQPAVAAHRGAARRAPRGADA